MKINATVFLLVGLLALAGCRGAGDGAAGDAQPIELRVMTFNIRNGRANDGANSWEYRRPLVYGVIRDSDPDIVGVQEAFDFQLADLAENLPAYAQVGEGRDGGTRGEHSSILYRRDRFDLAESGTFWLSDTPDVVSRSWGNRYHRVCTWARLIDRATGRGFYVFNTHLDHQSQNARFNSAVLIAQRIAGREHDEPVVLTGDFNAGEDNPVVRYLKGQTIDGASSPLALLDTFRAVHPDRENVATGNGGYTGETDGAKIDHIFVLPGSEIIEAAIDQQPRDGRYPSDHYPVTATVRLGP